MPKELFNTLKSHIEKFDTEEARKMYREGNFKNSDGCKDVNMRYRWDLLWLANHNSELNSMITDCYNHHDLNDDHINTALRKIVPSL